MQKKKNAPVTEKDVLPIWENLVRQERLLKRNRSICRIIQPVGLSLFVLGLALILFYVKNLVGTPIESAPTQFFLLELLRTDGLLLRIFLGLLIAYLIALLVSGVIAAIFYNQHKQKYTDVKEPLVGTRAQCAKALVYKAETVYELRSSIQNWPVFIPAGILTALTAVPLISACWSIAQKEPAVMDFSLYALALLLVLFVLFWVYVLLLWSFTLLNSLFYRSGQPWSYYKLYQKLDAYWESVDPKEYGRREHRRLLQEERKNRKRRNNETN